MFAHEFFNDDFFDSPMFDIFPAMPKPRPSDRNGRAPIMKTDVRECEDAFHFDIDLPGYKKEQVKAELNEGYLTIRAENSEENHEEKDGQTIRRERFTGSVQRTFFVGKAVNAEDIKAHFEDGVLKLEVPKKKLEVPERKPILIEG